MRIGIISDLHIDTNFNEHAQVDDALIKVLSGKNLDILIIAGDISDNYQKSLDVIRKVEDTGCKCLFVPGNHDIWNIDYPHIKNTQDIINEFRKHPGCLVNNPIQISKDYVVIGDIGWYDYTYGTRELSIDYYNKGYHMGKEWKDNLYVNWNMSHIEKTAVTYKELGLQLEKYKDKKIIFVTHMVTHHDFKLDMSDEYYKYINGFLGSSTYQSLLHSNVKHVVLGHVHLRKNLSDNNINYFCRCLSTKAHWITDDVEKEIEDALHILTLE